MCGIAGLYGIQNQAVVKAMINAIAHRGPDQPPKLVEKGLCTLSACVLSIENIEHPAQPHYFNELKVAICFNGEIYNYKVLLKELKSLGYTFEFNNELETLAVAYKIFGIDFIRRLKGMFSIALFDETQATLFIVRDTIGIKPLYYFERDGAFYFSSEIKSFFKAKILLPSVDEDYLAHRYIFDYGPIDKTLFNSIKNVRPGTFVKITPRSITEHKYEFDQKQCEVENCIEQLLTTAVEAMIPAMVPWGVLLSGGIDSSIILHIAKSIMGKDRINRNIFTLIDDIPTEDSKNSAEICAFLKLKYTVLNGRSTIEDLVNYSYCIEEFETASFFWYILFKQLSGKTKAVLCGQGADELFGGYSFYRNEKQSEYYTNKFLKIEHLLTARYKQTLSDKLNILSDKSGFYNDFLDVQLPWFQLAILDKCSMRFGIEARVPYLFQDLFYYVRSISISEKIDDRQEKYLLRKSFHTSKLPNLYRKKAFSGRSTLPLEYRNIEIQVNNLLAGEDQEKFEYFPYMNNSLEYFCLKSLITNLK